MSLATKFVAESPYTVVDSCFQFEVWASNRKCLFACFSALIYFLFEDVFCSLSYGLPNSRSDFGSDCGNANGDPRAGGFLCFLLFKNTCSSNFKILRLGSLVENGLPPFLKMILEGTNNASRKRSGT